MTNQKHISITKMPIVTKFGTIVTNLKGFLSMLLDPLVMWSCKLTQQTKTITSAQPQWLWPPNLAIVWITKRVPHHKVAWPYDQALYLHYHNAHGHRTCQDGDLNYVASTNITWPYNHVVLQDDRPTKIFICPLPQCLCTIKAFRSRHLAS